MSPTNPPMQPVILDDYVRDAFDGLIADVPDPMDYFGGDAIRDQQQKETVRAVRESIESLSGRPLNRSEMVKLVMFVALEWQRRCEKATEAAFDREQGKLWQNAETPFVRDY